jgi:PadR family transcriptional regulator PadR
LSLKARARRIELLPGTLDLLVLDTLRSGPSHGYGIAHLIRAHTADVLDVDAGSLYPALHRLERQGLVRAEWALSEKKQRTRQYRLTTGGRRRLAAERSKWQQMTIAISRLLNRSHAGGF